MSDLTEEVEKSLRAVFYKTKTQRTVHPSDGDSQKVQLPAELEFLYLAHPKDPFIRLEKADNNRIKSIFCTKTWN